MIHMTYVVERKELEMLDYIPCIFHVLQEFLLSKGKEFFLEQNKGLLSHLPGNYHRNPVILLCKLHRTSITYECMYC